MDRGSFGAPTFFVGQEMFIGNDRLDFAIEALAAAGKALIGRGLIGTMVPRLYASPAYLERRGRPKTPHDLTSHPTLLYAGGARPPRLEWSLSNGPRTESVVLFPALVSNDYAPLHAAALAGVGIVGSTRLMAEDAVRSGALVPVLPEWTGAPIEVRAVFPGRSGLFPRARAFIEMLLSRAAPTLARAEEMDSAEGTPAPRRRRA